MITVVEAMRRFRRGPALGENTTVLCARLNEPVGGAAPAFRAAAAARSLASRTRFKSLGQPRKGTMGTQRITRNDGFASMRSFKTCQSEAVSPVSPKVE